MRTTLMKRSMFSLGIEILLATALILGLTPTASHADMGAFLQNKSGGAQEIPADVAELGEVDARAFVENESVEPELFHFTATAYCLRGTTAAGVRVNSGSVAADPAILPLGSVIRVLAGKYSGIYTVLDTGAKVRGRKLDFWIPSYEEAIQFGVRKVKVEILRYGWEPTEKDADF